MTSGFILGHLRAFLDAGMAHSRAWPPREEEALPRDMAGRDKVPRTQSCGTHQLFSKAYQGPACLPQPWAFGVRDSQRFRLAQVLFCQGVCALTLITV